VPDVVVAPPRDLDDEVDPAVDVRAHPFDEPVGEQQERRAGAEPPRIPERGSSASPSGGPGGTGRTRARAAPVSGAVSTRTAGRARRSPRSGSRSPDRAGRRAA
jgi:hypothetical protein